MLREVVSVSRRVVGSVWWEGLCGFLLEDVYLYRWISQTISVSNDCGGGTRFWFENMVLLYCCQSHCSRVAEMVMR